MKSLNAWRVAFLLGLVSFAAAVYASPGSGEVALGAGFSNINMHPHMQVLRADEKMQLSDVQQMPGWHQFDSGAPLLLGQSLWLRMHFDYPHHASSKLALVIANPFLDKVDVFFLDTRERILASYRVGANRPIQNRPVNHRDFVFPFEMEDNQSVSVYVRIIDDGPMALTVELWDRKNLVPQDQLRMVFLGLIFGALAILSLYFLITYAMFRSPIRFWFSLFCALFLTTLLTMQGILSQISNLSGYLVPISSLLAAMLIITANKVAYALLGQVASFWRLLPLLLAGGLFVASFWLNAYLLLLALGGACLGNLALLAILTRAYRTKLNRAPALFNLLAWLLTCVAVGAQLWAYLFSQPFSFGWSAALLLFMLSGVLMSAIAIGMHEQLLTKLKDKQQQSVIADLREFYDLFRNSAEGLYTSSMQGQLLTTNPAMATLFGFASEQALLEKINNTSSLYADSKDRDMLLAELTEHGLVNAKEIKGIRNDGSEFWFSLSAQIQEKNGEQLVFGSLVDITERKQSSISLEYLATHDSLTGVYNRREFERKLREGLSLAEQQQSGLTLLYMDLDQFKVVNDTCGHKAGDILIKQLSQQLRDAVGNRGMMARLGGDEFGILLLNEHAENQTAYLLANKLLNVVKEFRFIWDNRIFTLGVSIGLVNWQDNISSADQMLSMADGACYVAKERGRNQIHSYSKSDEHTRRYESELVWVTHINNALKDNSFELYYQHYQPLSQLELGDHYELLIRMRDEHDAVIPPNAFLPAAERYNLSTKIDQWVVEHFFAWLADNPQRRASLQCCNINLSGASLSDKDFKLFLLRAFEKYGISYKKICFEITESMAIIKMDETLKLIETFRQLGCRFALDDFGSGFASYSHLKNLPVDYVKIDGSFVKDLLEDPIDMAMVCSMKDIANAMGMQTIAEFVENEAILRKLVEIGIDYAQGYQVARPQPLEAFSSLS